jgi:hypothetical protein
MMHSADIILVLLTSVFDQLLIYFIFVQFEIECFFFLPILENIIWYKAAPPPPQKDRKLFEWLSLFKSNKFCNINVSCVHQTV